MKNPVAAAAGDVEPLGEGSGGDDGAFVHLKQTHDFQKIAFVDAVFLGVGQGFCIGITVI